MKKILRLITLLLVSAFLITSFCGCQPLDEIKASRAIWSSNDLSKFKLNNQEYIQLPYYEYLQPYIDDESVIFVTEKDVPVLLSAVMGEPLYRDTTGYFYFTSYDYDNEFDLNYYCREDKYEETLRRIENYSKNGFTPEAYCYSYYSYDEELTKYYILTDQQHKAVDDVLSTVQGTALPGEMNILYDYSVLIEECSKDMVFSRVKMDIYVKNNEYFISRDIEGKTVIYTVPPEHNNIFADIMAPYISAEQFME